MKAFLPMQVFLTKVLKLGLTKKWSGMSLQHIIFCSNHCHLLVYLRCFPALIFYKMGGYTQFTSYDVIM